MPPKKGSKKVNVGNAPDKGLGKLRCLICKKPYAEHKIQRCTG